MLDLIISLTLLLWDDVEDDDYENKHDNKHYSKHDKKARFLV